MALSLKCLRFADLFSSGFHEGGDSFDKAMKKRREAETLGTLGLNKKDDRECLSLIKVICYKVISILYFVGVIILIRPII